MALAQRGGLESLGMLEAGGVSAVRPDGAKTFRLVTDFAPVMEFTLLPDGDGWYVAAVSISASD